MKFNRRHILLAGLGAGVTGRITQEHWRIRSVLKQQKLKTLANATLADDISIIDAAYASEANWENEVEKRKKLLASNILTPPTQPYNREMAKRLIHVCKLAVQQYKTARANPNYDGTIKLLPDYEKYLDVYTQSANFTLEQDIIEDYFRDNPLDAPSSNSTSVEETIQEVELTLQDKVRQILQRQYRIRVYSGILLTSKEHNILVFRGTQTQAEWLKNLNAAQQMYVSPSGKDYGEVHKGFFQLTRNLSPSLAEVAKKLDPTIPCYITGHSLGAAIATLAAMELIQAVPQIQDQIQLYTFAGPRVCSPTFAKIHSQLIPNAYRIVNLGDTVPLVPPVTIGNSYVHIGQEWSFLAQFGDVLLNHVVDTYQTALEQELESDRASTVIQQLKIP
jgi:predicted lipase